MSGARGPKVLAVAPGPIVSAVLQVIKPLAVLESRGAVEVRHTFPWLCRTRDIAWADCVVFCRATTVAEYGLLREARRLGRPVIYDIDDNLFDLPGDDAVARFHLNPIHQHVLRAFHREADLVQVYNPLLLDVARRHGAAARLMPQYFDRRLVADVRQSASGPVAIAFPTSRGGGDSLSALFSEALVRVASERPGAVAVHVWGARPPALAGVASVIVETFEPSYNAFIRALHARGYAVGLAPLQDDAHHRCKTELKFREYGGCGIAGIYSDVPPYRDAVADGRTGLLVAPTTEAWADALHALIDRPSLRLQIAAAARVEVGRHYRLESAAEAWQSSLVELTRDRQRRPALPRLSLNLKRRLSSFAYANRALIRPDLCRRDMEWLRRAQEDERRLAPL